MTWLSRTLSSAALVLCLFGCTASPDYAALCTEREKCIGGNDADVKACVDLAELGESQAETRDCGDVYRAAVECVADASACKDETVGYCNQDADCDSYGGGRCVDYQCARKRFASDDDACEAERNAYSACYGKELGQ
jgi:hypothetical protein